jgi:hypothetical protein
MLPDSEEEEKDQNVCVCVCVCVCVYASVYVVRSIDYVQGFTGPITLEFTGFVRPHERTRARTRTCAHAHARTCSSTHEIKLLQGGLKAHWL